MALITRCPACHTMFKVVADQFRVAQGWVRCGHCGDVFEAALNLVPAEADARHPPPRPQPDVPADFWDQAETQALPLEALLPGQFGPAREDDPLAREPEQAPTPASQRHRPRAANWTQAQPEPGAAQDAPADALMADPVLAPAPAAPEVSFVRDARRSAFWKRPLVRVLLALLSLVLLTALLLQWVLQQKDNLAAMDPRLAPFLQTLCNTLDCEIRPPRHIESVVIDSSNFSKIAPDVYRLSFVLKNTSTASVEIPSLEITLVDAQEQALVRRVLAPQQFGAGATALAARAELPGVVVLKVAGELAPDMPAPPPLPVNGYRILAFYP